ncbi:hypothetical protein FKM82_016900 [Ascaphus truei]
MPTEEPMKESPSPLQWRFPSVHLIHMTMAVFIHIVCWLQGTLSEEGFSKEAVPVHRLSPRSRRYQSESNQCSGKAEGVCSSAGCRAHATCSPRSGRSPCRTFLIVPVPDGSGRLVQMPEQANYY